MEGLAGGLALSLLSVVMSKVAFVFNQYIGFGTYTDEAPSWANMIVLTINLFLSSLAVGVHGGLLCLTKHHWRQRTPWLPEPAQQRVSWTELDSGHL